MGWSYFTSAFWIHGWAFEDLTTVVSTAAFTTSSMAASTPPAPLALLRLRRHVCHILHEFSYRPARKRCDIVEPVRNGSDAELRLQRHFQNGRLHRFIRHDSHCTLGVGQPSRCRPTQQQHLPHYYNSRDQPTPSQDLEVSESSTPLPWPGPARRSLCVDRKGEPYAARCRASESQAMSGWAIEGKGGVGKSCEKGKRLSLWSISSKLVRYLRYHIRPTTM